MCKSTKHSGFLLSFIFLYVGYLCIFSNSVEVDCTMLSSFIFKLFLSVIRIFEAMCFICHQLCVLAFMLPVCHLCLHSKWLVWAKVQSQHSGCLLSYFKVVILLFFILSSVCYNKRMYHSLHCQNLAEIYGLCNLSTEVPSVPLLVLY